MKVQLFAKFQQQQKMFRPLIFLYLKTLLCIWSSERQQCAQFRKFQKEKITPPYSHQCPTTWNRGWIKGPVKLVVFKCTTSVTFVAQVCLQYLPLCAWQTMVSIGKEVKRHTDSVHCLVVFHHWVYFGSKPNTSLSIILYNNNNKILYWYSLWLLFLWEYFNQL